MLIGLEQELPPFNRIRKTMLCDDVVASLTRYRSGLHQGARAMAAMISHAQRFVLAPLVVSTINALADAVSVERMADNLFLPAHRTWIEWTDDDGRFGGGRRAVLLMGTLQLVKDGPPYPLDSPMDLHSGVMVPFQRPVVAPAFGATQQIPFDLTAFRIGQGEIAAWIWSAIALINTPRIARCRQHDTSALDKAHPRRAHLSYVDVTLSPDTSAIDMSHRVTGTDGRARHHVRAHMRLRRGLVEIVRPHWRGNVKNGIRLHRHLVRRAEDEPGMWSGGPLPPPRMLEPNDSD